MKKDLKIKDHFLSKEVFNVVEHSEGVLKTQPDLDENTLDKYYDSSQYSSHYNIGGFIGFLYSLSAYIMLRFKFRALEKYINKESLIVDFGCGKGGFLSYLKKKKYTVVGVDINKKARDKCLKKNLKTYKSINDFKENIDAITFWHSFEHVSNPNEILDQIINQSKNNLTIVIALPNYRSFDAKHYGSFWAAYDAPRHRFHYSVRGIKKLMKSYGFECLKTKPMLLDAFYISIMSEKYKKSKLSFVKGIMVGLISNLSALYTSNYSSSVFVFKKTI
jgi:2-polyprenyl-3-methyl-5-hydroxy-6-metoxy-1,4-benzoquinol methylase